MRPCNDLESLTLCASWSSVLQSCVCPPMAGVEANQPSVGASSNDLTPPYAPDRRNFVYRFLQECIRLVAPIYLRYRARGVEHVPARGPALLVVNHQSFLDPVMAGLRIDRPLRFLARSSLYRGPLIRALFDKLYVIPLNRDAASSATIRQAARELEQGHLIGIFPEGTRSEDGRIGT